MRSETYWDEVSFKQVQLNDRFWKPRIGILKQTTLPACLDQCEKTGRILNFRKAAGIMKGEFEGDFCFNDSDVYKAIEGAAYLLMHELDSRLESELDRIIDWIAAAQEPDGYLDTYFTLSHPDAKWTDMYLHEMYCGGHLMEAAAAYYAATGKRKLLDCACRLADHYDTVFGPGKRHWVPGHEEIELALAKLYRATGEERYLKLAIWLLDERGHGHGKGHIWDRIDWGPAYCQDDVPVRDIREVKGHAVRAMYLYTGMADVARLAGDASYLPALERVWEHTVQRNMYITGGIGPSRHNEGFTSDYDLPNETAYCETCAAVAMVLWNHRMNLLTGDAKYADIVEKEMYNGTLSGVSLSGDLFFYENPLASRGHHHRMKWFTCPCCPMNLARYMASIGNYIYAAAPDGITVNQYIQSSHTIQVPSGGQVTITQQTDFPWNGQVELKIKPTSAAEMVVRLRIPDWCRSYRLSLNDEPLLAQETCLHKGYLAIRREWHPGDRLSLWLDMPVERVHAHSRVTANRGRVAFQRGPVVYCLEQTDNPDLAYDDITIASNAPFQIRFREDFLGGVIVLSGTTDEGNLCTLIPYFAWDNREPGFMQVWIKHQNREELYQRG